MVEQENMSVEKTLSQKLKDYEKTRNPNWLTTSLVRILPATPKTEGNKSCRSRRPPVSSRYWCVCLAVNADITAEVTIL